jgi:hypothetical protein
MFGCRDATLLLTEEREGALAGWVRTKYRFHLTICVHCRRYRRQFDQALALSREAPAAEVPAELEEAAVEAFRSRKKV